MVGEATNGGEALRLARELRPDVVLRDSCSLTTLITETPFDAVSVSYSDSPTLFTKTNSPDAASMVTMKRPEGPPTVNCQTGPT